MQRPAPENDPLLDLQEVILTPHLGGGSRMNGLLDAKDMLLSIEHVIHQSAK
jgi:D-3-phosphoglycerate dehydrogenase